MNTSEQISNYRFKVSRLLMALRYALFNQSGQTSYPTDSSIALMLDLTPTALSSISRQCASMSGITLLKLLKELSSRTSSESFIKSVQSFLE